VCVYTCVCVKVCVCVCVCVYIYLAKSARPPSDSMASEIRLRAVAFSFRKPPTKKMRCAADGPSAAAWALDTSTLACTTIFRVAVTWCLQDRRKAADRSNMTVRWRA